MSELFVEESQTSGDVATLPTVSPLHTSRGKRKKVENQEEISGRHIDAVFKEATYQLINKVVEEENFPTRSALIREAVELYLNFKVIAKPTDTLVVLDEDGQQRFVIPMRMIA